MIAEGWFFIHKRHVHIIPAGASVDVLINVDIILLLIVIVATKLRCNGFVLNINNSKSVSQESQKVGEFGKSELTLDGCGEDVPNNCLWRLVVATTGGSFWVVAMAACGAGSSATAFCGRLDGGRGLEVAPPVRLTP